MICAGRYLIKPFKIQTELILNTIIMQVSNLNRHCYAPEATGSLLLKTTNKKSFAALKMICAMLIASFVFVQGSFGQTTYTGASNGSWNTGSNWSAGVPTLLVDAIIPT